MKKYYKLSKDEVLNELEVDVKGLSKEQVNKRQKKYGLNELEKKKK